MKIKRNIVAQIISGGFFGMSSVKINNSQIYLAGTDEESLRFKMFWKIIQYWTNPIEKMRRNALSNSPIASLLISEREYKFLKKLKKHQDNLIEKRARKRPFWRTIKIGKKFNVGNCYKEVGKAKEKLGCSFGYNSWEKKGWKIICSSYTKIRDKYYCDSYSYISIENNGEKIKVFDGKFRDGQYESKDNPDLMTPKVGIIDVNNKEIFFVVYTRIPEYFKAYLV